MKLAEHPTVLNLRARGPERERSAEPPSLDPQWLRQACLDAGADDVGFVEIERPAVADQRSDIERALPGARTLVSFVVRMNRDDIRTPFRSVANLEFHRAGDQSNEVAHHIAELLQGRGARAINPAMGFPMEMDHFPGKVWVVSHKPVAVAAGLGQIGLHRNVIHPRFGNFILLGTVITDAVIEGPSAPVSFNPCLECKLCVAACPVGAVKADGAFDFGACYTHNYREFMSGFTDFTEQLVAAKDLGDKRRRIRDTESVSMWQSLSFGANYKAAYCMAVCPAGEDVIPPFLMDRKRFVGEVVRPLQQKEEPVYVVPGTDAEAHVLRRFPHKEARRVRSGLRSATVAGFVNSLPLVFQREQTEGVNARFCFVFTGAESLEVTVSIIDGELTIESCRSADADVTIVVDSQVWLEILRKERRIVWAIVRGKMKVGGRRALLRSFSRCFRS